MISRTALLCLLSLTTICAFASDKKSAKIRANREKIRAQKDALTIAIAPHRNLSKLVADAHKQKAARDARAEPRAESHDDSTLVNDLFTGCQGEE